MRNLGIDRDLCKKIAFKGINAYGLKAIKHRKAINWAGAWAWLTWPRSHTLVCFYPKSIPNPSQIYPKSIPNPSQNYTFKYLNIS